ncbi:hypothetical protein J4216_06205 [Candidatus Woesearchaeota archaeon]|nr:hypothetical protein [Candidatus Woesearchaeota archaeon]
MNQYNAPKDLGYKVSSDNSNYVTKQVQQSSYGGEQGVVSSLPIYKPQNEQFNNRTSQCPRGAELGQKASRCGAACSGACLIPS